MSSYHTSFKYLNKNSSNDFNWLIVHFDADTGETDGFMSQEQVYDDTYRGTRRIVYGTKWTSAAEIKITVIKQDGTDFTLQECRDAYRWLTGSNQTNWLDLYSGQDEYSFLVTNADVKPQKLDARTVALNIYFQSVSPWAYSQPVSRICSFGQSLIVDDDGVLDTDKSSSLRIDADGVLTNNNSAFSFEDGAIYLDNYPRIVINNESDDLYTYVYLDTEFNSINSDFLSIKNETLNEETTISNITPGEKITLSSGQFILSNALYDKIFGDDFNWIWPRLGPGINSFVVGGSGQGTVVFTYRYPIKVGDLAINVDVSVGGINCF